jgi:hypothetical protein
VSGTESTRNFERGGSGSSDCILEMADESRRVVCGDRDPSRGAERPVVGSKEAARDALQDAGREVRVEGGRMFVAKKGAIEAGRVLGGDTSDSWSAAMSCTSAQDDNDDEDLVVNRRDGMSELVFARPYCGIVARMWSLRNPHGSSNSVWITLLG